MADILLPEPKEGFEYVLVPKRKERIILLREERDMLKAKLDAMDKPNNEELISFGKTVHPYSRLEDELEAIKTQISEYR